jgi:hypothetical protein
MVPGLAPSGAPRDDTDVVLRLAPHIRCIDTETFGPFLMVW